jgi:hypothetical protein
VNVFPEPTWTVPQEALEACSAFCTRGPNPFVLSGVFLRLLQYHFSSSDNIDEPLLKEYIWTPSTKGCLSEVQEGPGGSSQLIPGSRLLIRPSYTQNPDQIQQSPALFVKREPFGTERISFQDASLPSKNAKGIVDGRKHQVNISGAHSIICKGLTGAEAELLGQEVFFRMLHYQQVIKKDFALGSLMADGVSEVKQRTDEAKSSFYTVVRLSWAYVYRWLVIPESPVLKRVALEFNV